MNVHVGWKWKWSRSVMSHWLFATPWTVAYQAPQSMGFSRQKCWNGLPFPSPGDLPDPGIEPGSPALQADALPSEPPGKPMWDGWLQFRKGVQFWKAHQVAPCLEVSWCSCICVYSVTQWCPILWPWTTVHQTPLSVEFPRQEHGVSCYFLLQEIFLNQRSNLHLLHLLCWQADSLPQSHVGSPGVLDKGSKSRKN